MLKLLLVFVSSLLAAQVGYFYGGASYFEAERLNKGTEQFTDFKLSPSIFIGLNRPFLEMETYSLGYYLEFEKFLLREDRTNVAADYDLYHLNLMLFASAHWHRQSSLIIKSFYTFSLGDIHNRQNSNSLSNELGDFEGRNYGYAFAIDYIHPKYSNMKIELSYKSYLKDFLNDRFDRVQLLKQFRIILFIEI